MSETARNMNLLNELESLRNIISREIMRSRKVVHAWIATVYEVGRVIAQSQDLLAQLQQEHDRRFSKHPKTTFGWMLVKLAILETGTPVQTAHRWGQAIEFARQSEWTKEQLMAALDQGGIENVLGSCSHPQPTVPIAARSAQKIAQRHLDFPNLHASQLPAEIKGSVPYVLVVIREANELRVTKCLRQTKSLAEAIRIAERKMTTKPRRARRPANSTDAHGAAGVTT